MRAEIEFLQRELAFVGLIRKTRQPKELHLVEPAVRRERQILAEIERLKVDPPDRVSDIQLEPVVEGGRA